MPDLRRSSLFDEPAFSISQARRYRRRVEALTRGEVENLLASGVPWTIRFCGDELPSKAGVGTVNFPSGVVNHIPTPAALRKLRRGTASKTYFHATLNEVAGSPTLELVEG